MKAAPFLFAILTIAAGAFVGGRYAGTMNRRQAENVEIHGEEIAAAVIGDRATRQEEPPDSSQMQAAMSEALLAMLDTGSYEQFGSFYSAIKRLDLPHVRELHARVVQMPGDTRLLEA